jgi:PAS domain S-box-containing protein
MPAFMSRLLRPADAPGKPYGGVAMNARRIARIRASVAVPALGAVGIGLVTWTCFHFGVNVTTAVLAYLTVVVAASLADSLVSSVILSVAAVGCLNYFFLEPVLSMRVASAQDVLVLVVFLFTSWVITGLVQRVRMLAESRREQARLLDLTQDPVFVRDASGLITYWNRGAEQLYGWSSGEARGKCVHKLLQTGFPAPLEEINAAVRDAGRWEGELVNVRRDGAQVVVSSRWALQRDEYGTPTGILETNNDITDQKRAQDLLRRSQEAYLAEAQRLSSTGSFGWDVATGKTFWSEETYRIFGYPPAVRPSVDMVLQRVHPDDVARVRAAIENATRSGAGFDIEHRLQLPDGAVKHLRVVVRPMADETAGPQFVGAVMDVTAARRAEDRLQRAHSDLAHVSRLTSLGELTASIAHEVNQPLAAIVTNGELSLDWLARGDPPLDDVAEALREMVDDGRRASDVVQRVRAMINKSEQRKSATDLNGVIEGVVPLIRRELSDHGVSLRLDLAPALPPVRGDGVQMQQVILNLAINGIQAMADVHDRPRSLVIESRCGESGDVLVAVRDSGTGFDPGGASRMFDAFFTTRPHGLGMGLSICRSIIEAHEGRLSAAAAEDGPGSVFQFRLPPLLTEAGAPAAAPPGKGTWS